MKRRSNHQVEVGRHTQGRFPGLNVHQESLILNHNGTAKHELVCRLFNLFRSSDQFWKNGQKAGPDDLGIWPNPPTPGERPGSATPHENSDSDKPPREFDFRKDKLAFFEKEFSRILDHIYLGSDAIAKKREILRQNGITHVLNCMGFVCPEYFKNELVYKTLWLHDCSSEDVTSILYDVFDYFEDVREQGKRVVVHCCQGVSRSNSLVIAYLMWKEGVSFDDAFQHVKAVEELLTQMWDLLANCCSAKNECILFLQALLMFLGCTVWDLTHHMIPCILYQRCVNPVSKNLTLEELSLFTFLVLYMYGPGNIAPL